MACGQWALLRRTTLGMLTSPAREGSILDAWAPLEVAKFEAAMCLVGKQFPVVAKVVGTKSTAEVINFYYTWKQSKNYGLWKAAWRQGLGGEQHLAQESAAGGAPL